MKYIFCLIAAIVGSLPGSAQGYGITDDGKFVFGELYAADKDQPVTAAVRSTTGSWYLELVGATNFTFSPDNKWLYYQQRGSLHKRLLGFGRVDSIKGVGYYRLEGKDKSLLVYRMTGTQSINVRNLRTNREFTLADVSSYFLHPTKNVLFAKVSDKISSIQKVIRLDLESNTEAIIWNSSSERIVTHTFSHDAKQLALLTAAGDQKFLWLYSDETKKVKKILEDSSSGIHGKYRLGTRILQFSPNGKRLCFYLSFERKFPENEYRKDIEDVVSYLDPKPNYYWRRDSKQRKNHLASIDLISGKTTVVEQENDLVVGSPFISDKSVLPLQMGDNYALIYHFRKEAFSYGESGRDQKVIEPYTAYLYNFNKYVHPDIYLVNLVDGTRQMVKSQAKVISSQFPVCLLSPSESHVLYFDTEESDYYALAIKTATRHKVSQSISTNLYWSHNSLQRSGVQRKYFNLMELSNHIVWWKGENATSAVIQDSFGDIWEIMLDGADAVCLTKGFARKNKLRLFIENYTPSNVILDKSLLLGAHSSSSGTSSYYELNLVRKNGVRKLLGSEEYSDVQFKHSKSGLMNVWKISNAATPPTIFFGRNFDNRQPLTKVSTVANPVRRSNLCWKDSLGKEQMGVIFFPKDFDSTKKYPVLINYYEQIQPYLQGYLDYADFAAETRLGYILFVPDITFTVGYTGKSVANIVISGARELMKLPYINAKKVGVFGGSFSGYQTNFIVGQTDIFAAAFSTAGLSNLSSSIGLEDRDSEQRIDMGATINGQNNMGVTLWERPDLYLANSPVFFADRVTCPVLLAHGRQDYRVQFQQGMEFYKALQANGKKVWLIAPDGGHDGAAPGRILNDRYATQFFGHYLKDEPAPYWMTRPAIELLQKGLSPYDYDPEIKTPGDGIIPKEKTYAPQVQELLNQRTMIDNNGRIVDVKN